MSYGDKERSYGRTSRGTVNIAEPFKPTGHENVEVSRHIREARDHVDETIGYKLTTNPDGAVFITRAHKTPEEVAELQEQSAQRDAAKAKRKKGKRIVKENLWTMNTTESMNAIMPKHLDDKYGPKIHKEYIRNRDKIK